MIWLVYIVLIAATGAAVAFTRKSRNVPTTQPTTYDAPRQIDRADFPEATSEVIVVVFTSRVCESCATIWSKASVVQSDFVDVVRVEFEDERGKKLHARYDIEAVPTVIVCDREGVTQKAFLGSVTSTDLWAGVASVRGDTVAECTHH